MSSFSQTIGSIAFPPEAQQQDRDISIHKERKEYETDEEEEEEEEKEMQCRSLPIMGIERDFSDHEKRMNEYNTFLIISVKERYGTSIDETETLSIELEKHGRCGKWSRKLCTIQQGGILYVEPSNQIKNGLDLKKCDVSYDHKVKKIVIKYNKHKYTFRLPKKQTMDYHFHVTHHCHDNKQKLTNMETRDALWNFLINTLHCVCSGYNSLKQVLNWWIKRDKMKKPQLLEILKRKLHYDNHMNKHALTQLIDLIGSWDESFIKPLKKILASNVLLAENPAEWSARATQALVIDGKWKALLQAIKVQLTRIGKVQRWQEIKKKGKDRYTFKSKVDEYDRIQTKLLEIAQKIRTFQELVDAEYIEWLKFGQQVVGDEKNGNKASKTCLAILGLFGMVLFGIGVFLCVYQPLAGGICGKGAWICGSLAWDQLIAAGYVTAGAGAIVATAYKWRGAQIHYAAQNDRVEIAKLWEIFKSQIDPIYIEVDTIANHEKEPTLVEIDDTNCNEYEEEIDTNLQEIETLCKTCEETIEFTQSKTYKN